MRVIALFRVSTERQANDGASLDAQQRLYREMAAKQGWTTVAEFKGCESASQAAVERHVLQSALACIREHKPDALWVVEQSRLTRGDRLEAAMLMRELVEHRIKIIVNGAVRDPSSIDEEMVFSIQSAVDHAEARRIKDRMQRGKRQRALEGKKTSGPAPYGYMNPAPGQPGRGTLQVVEAEAVIVRKLFDLAAQGLGTRAIALRLNAMGMPAPRGGAWAKSSVGRVLTCPAYIGTQASGIWRAEKGSRTFRMDMHAPDAAIKEGAHEAIIDRETWTIVHGRAKQVRTAKPRLLSGILYVDGAKAEATSSHGDSWYRPPRGVRGQAWLDAPATDEAVWEAFVSLATGESFVQSLMAQTMSPHEKMVVEQEIDYLREQIGKLNKRLANFVEMRADGDLSKDEFRTKSQEAKDTIDTRRAELERLESKLRSLDEGQAARVVQAIRVLLRGQRVLTIEQRRTVLRSIVRRVDIEAKRTEGDFERDAAGRVLEGSTLRRWGVAKVLLTFALGPTGGNGGDDAPREPGTDELQDEAVRSSHKGTNFCHSGQLAATEGSRSSHKATALCHSGQVAETGGTRSGHKVAIL